MRVLVVGPARSGTSWVATTLGGTPGAGVLREPDSGSQPFAVRATSGMGDLPILGREDPGPPALRRLWDVAFGAPVRYVRGQHRLARWLHRHAGDWHAGAAEPDDGHVTRRRQLAGMLAVPRNFPAGLEHHVVKSIRAQFMLDWIEANWQPVVVVCRRHPLDVVASRLALGLVAPEWSVMVRVAEEARARYGVDPLSPDAPALERATWRVGLQMSVLDDALAAHPEYWVADHERFCAAPVERFRELATGLGLRWTADDEARIEASNRPGTGFELNRVAATLPGSWRRRLSADDAQRATRVLSQFPVVERYDMAIA